jgi:hypothetical protein
VVVLVVLVQVVQVAVVEQADFVQQLLQQVVQVL